MNEELYKYAAEAGGWKSAAAGIANELRLVDAEAARRTASDTLSAEEAEKQRREALQPLRDAFSRMTSDRWQSPRRLYTYGQIDADILVLACENRILSWQDAFNAKAAFGEAADLVAISEAAKEAGSNITPNYALPHAARPTLLVKGLRTEGNIATTEQLFKMGADPNYDNNGQLFLNVVSEGRADIGRVFARYGQDGLLSVDNWAKWAKNNRKLELYAELRKIQWEYGRFTVLDNDTIVEKKELPDNAGNLRIMFNFASRRVTEMLETANPRQTLVTDYSFEDYGERALEKAREKLVEMGADPAGVEIPLRGKAVVARPAGIGLPGKKASPGT